MSRQESDHPEERDRPLRGLRKRTQKDLLPWAVRYHSLKKNWVLYGRYKTKDQAQSAIDRELRRYENMNLFYKRVQRAAPMYVRHFKIVYEGNDGQEAK